MDNNHPTSGPAIAGDQRVVIAEPMGPEVLEALRGSIAKWEKIVARTAVDHGHNDCPLCDLFYRGICSGCPVMTRTGKMLCRDTPYRAFKDGGEQIKDAQAELDFLKSLLPESAS